MTEERNLHHACPDLEAWSAYVDGSSRDPDPEGLQAHLRDCDHCFGIVSSLRLSLARVQGAAGRLEESDDVTGPPAVEAEEPALVPAAPAAYPDAPGEPTPPDLLARARELVPQPATRPRRWALYGAAAGVLLAVVSSLYVGQRYLGEPRSPTAVFLGDGVKPVDEEHREIEYQQEAYGSAAPEPDRGAEDRLEHALGADGSAPAESDLAGPALDIGASDPIDALALAKRLLSLESPPAAGNAGADLAGLEGEGGGLIGADAVVGAGARSAEPAEGHGVGTLASAGSRGAPSGPLTGGPALKSVVPAGQGLAGTAAPAAEQTGAVPSDGPGEGLASSVQLALAAGREAAQLQQLVAQGGDGSAILARIESLRESLAALGPAPRTAATLRVMAAGLVAPERDSGRAAGGAMLMARRMDAHPPQVGDRARLLLLGQRLDAAMAAEYPGAASAYLVCGAWLHRLEMTADPGRGRSEGTDLEELAASGAEVLVRLRQAGADPQVTGVVDDLVERLEDRTVRPDSGAILDALEALRIGRLPSP